MILLYLKMFNTNWGLIGKYKKKKMFFKINIYSATPKPTLTLNGILNKRNYRLKIMLLHPNLTKTARVDSKLCSLLITTLTYRESKT